MTYVIGTGWWCNGTGKHPWSGLSASCDETRSVGFFDTWHKHVSLYAKPEKIFIVDSASPVTPDFNRPLLEVIRLTKNFTEGVGGEFLGLKRTAAMRQLFIGAAYAVANSVDYFVWLEQDCLIYGRGIIEKAIANMGEADYSMGRWKHKYKMETSLMIFKTESVFRLLLDFGRAHPKRPELKFDVLQSDYKLAVLPFGYGRNRPINFNDSYFYAQHLTKPELDQFKKKAS